MSLDERILILGAGEMASGVAWRLARCGFDVWMTELPQPLAVRRLVSFASAVYEGEIEIEGIRGMKTIAENAHQEGDGIPVVVDPESQFAHRGWDVIVDGRMAKRNLGVSQSMAPLVIGLGPGFEAGRDVHLVVETSRGSTMGRVVQKGAATGNTGMPEPVMGISSDRVFRAPLDGEFHGTRRLGELVQPGDEIGRVGEAPLVTKIRGVVRGMLHDGVKVKAGTKVADVYPRTDVDIRRISDKALAIGGGVLEAILSRKS